LAKAKMPPPAKNKKLCNVCGKDDADPTHKCPTCNNYAHESCISVWGNITKKSARLWRCEFCVPSGPASPVFESAQQSDLATQLQSMQSKIIDTVNAHTSGQIAKIEATLAETKKQVAEQGAQIKKLEADKAKMREQMEKQQEQINALQKQSNELAQAQLLNNVEIHGIPFMQGEDVLAVVTEVAGVVNAPETIDNVAAAYRGRKMRNKPPPIIVKFYDVSDKEKWMEGRKSTAFKNYKKPMTFVESAAAKAKKGDKGGEVKMHQVRILEQLTPFNRQLLFEAKKAAAECNVAYVWPRGGKILARRTPNSETVFRITCFDDITTKIRLQQNDQYEVNQPPANND
jgi:hypothetical protein